MHDPTGCCPRSHDDRAKAVTDVTIAPNPLGTNDFGGGIGVASVITMGPKISAYLECRYWIAGRFEIRE